MIEICLLIYWMSKIVMNNSTSIVYSINAQLWLSRICCWTTAPANRPCTMCVTPFPRTAPNWSTLLCTCFSGMCMCIRISSYRTRFTANLGRTSHYTENNPRRTFAFGWGRGNTPSDCRFIHTRGDTKWPFTERSAAPGNLFDLPWRQTRAGAVDCVSPVERTRACLLPCAELFRRRRRICRCAVAQFRAGRLSYSCVCVSVLHCVFNEFALKLITHAREQQNRRNKTHTQN